MAQDLLPPGISIGDEVMIDPAGLPAYLALPKAGQGIVVFAHGSGSGRHSPRNQFVAKALQQFGLGTLLLDLLTEREALDRTNVFDIGLLARRLNVAAEWLARQEQAEAAPIGYFGASTGGGAAIVAAAGSRVPIGAIVSRGGRPDLAGAALAQVAAPTLLIVGGDDTEVLALNRHALDKMMCEKKLEIVPGAGHLFEEPGALDRVVVLARDWFLARLRKVRPS